MPTRSNAPPSTQPVSEVQRDTSNGFGGGYCLGSRFERTRALDDRGSRVLLRRAGTPQERPEHDDDERGRARRDRRAVDAVRLLDRVWSRQLMVGWLLLARPESRGARAESDL